MLKLFFMLSTLLSGLFADKSEVQRRPANAPTAKGSFYDFKMKTLDGKQTVDFSQFKGKKVVVLNTASACGYTPQYADWEKFYKANKDKVVVLGFPANDFGAQESGSNAEIATFCQKNYGVSFPMFEKIHVVGSEQHPLYQWLTTKDLNGWNDKAPTWNFCKYLLNERGELVSFFGSKIKPDSEDFLAALKK
jgi:glutathione peroxidase